MADSSDSQPGFFARLKQHHLYGVVVVYAVIAGFLVQLTSRALPAFGWGGAFPAVIIILLAGFPVAVALAWTLIKPKEPTKYTRWQKVHWKFGAILSVSVVAAAVISGVSAWRWEQRHAARLFAEQTAAQASTRPAAPAFNPPADSIAVLPFSNLSGDPHQRYFSDGITEELTGTLGQTAALTVIAWDTASHYRDSNDSPMTIGKALNVATLLHGSIEREGKTVRVMAELVDTRTGTQLWAAHYDDSPANIFQVQDRISAAIAQALQVKFAGLGPVRKVNPEAHDLVLKARALMSTGKTAAPFEQARTLLQQAIALDPNYAAAHSDLAGVWYVLTEYSTLPLKDALPKIRAEANLALALNSQDAAALVVLANADALEGKTAAARTGYQHALAIDPSNSDAHLNYGLVLPLKQALAQQQEAVQLDPDNVGAQNNLATINLDLGQYQQALGPWQATIRLDPHSADNAFGLALTYALLHQYADAVKAFDLVQPSNELGKTLVATGRLVYQSLLDPKLRPRALAAVQELHKRSDLDPQSMEDVLQLYSALGETAVVLDLLPKFCAAAPFGCSDLSLNPLLLSLHGDPRFQKLVQQYDTVSKPAPADTATQ